MKTRVVSKVTIAAPAASIFTYLIDLKHHFLWNPHLQSISPLSVLTPTTSYKSTSLLLGIKVRGKNKVNRLIAAKELELENQTGLIRYVVNYRLQPADDKTVLTCTTTLSSNSTTFGFAVSALKLLARRELQSDLQALKIVVEEGLA